jgi:hypothetical protein
MEPDRKDESWTRQVSSLDAVIFIFRFCEYKRQFR